MFDYLATLVCRDFRKRLTCAHISNIDVGILCAFGSIEWHLYGVYFCVFYGNKNVNVDKKKMK